MTVCADVEALVPMQTPFSQLCPGCQCSFPPMILLPFFLLIFLPLLSLIFPHVFTPISSNQFCLDASPFLFFRTTLLLFLFLSFFWFELTKLNYSEPVFTFGFTLLPSQNDRSKLTWPLSANEDCITKPSQVNPSQTKPCPTHLWQPISPAPLHLAANALGVKRLPVRCYHLQKEERFLDDLLKRQQESLMSNQPDWQGAYIPPPKWKNSGPQKWWHVPIHVIPKIATCSMG